MCIWLFGRVHSNAEQFVKCAWHSGRDAMLHGEDDFQVDTLQMRSTDRTNINTNISAHAPITKSLSMLPQHMKYIRIAGQSRQKYWMVFWYGWCVGEAIYECCHNILLQVLINLWVQIVFTNTEIEYTCWNGQAMATESNRWVPFPKCKSTYRKECA